VCAPCCDSASVFFFSTDIATTWIFTLSLHDALPIFPSGRIKKSAASILGTLAFAIGSFLAYQVNMTAFYVSLAIVLMCLLYNGKAKHHFLAGPIVMGACRGLNLLLGMAVLPDALRYWYIAIIQFIS